MSGFGDDFEKEFRNTKIWITTVAIASVVTVLAVVTFLIWAGVKLVNHFL